MKSHKQTIVLTLVLAITACALLVKCTHDWLDSPPTPRINTDTPEQTAGKLKKEAEFQRVVLGARLLKQQMKNPDSFKLNSAMMMKSGAICYEYRATNSFNAVVPGTFVLAPKVASKETRDWNKHCAGQSGTDYTSARQAL